MNDGRLAAITLGLMPLSPAAAAVPIHRRHWAR